MLLVKKFPMLLGLSLSGPLIVMADEFQVPYNDFLAQTEISVAALAVLEDYRIKGCEQNDGVRGYRPNIDYVPEFMLVQDSYRRVELTTDGVSAEFIQSSGMKCGHLYLEYCGSGGCQSQIVVDDKVYPISGQPFLLVPEPSYESASENPLSAIIAWWGYGGSCRTQEVEETDPIQITNSASCLLTAQYDHQLNRLVFQHDYNQWPTGLDKQ
ncbi:hypothetical protein [Pelagovum sp. HNIBRBA483]|uniref:hypothetical protein n=1 Tax=Pelagovum sp. HNIBRBA483 TaxID=3233341 RepID=UPI0034A2E911